MHQISDTPIASTELPSNIREKLPMYGKQNVQSWHVFTLTRNMTAYKFRHRKHDAKGSDGWQTIYKKSDANIRIYAKLLKEGTHDVDGTASMYLLTDDVQYGIVLELIYSVLTNYYDNILRNY